MTTRRHDRKSGYGNPIPVTWYFRYLRERGGLSLRDTIRAAIAAGYDLPLAHSGNVEKRGVAAITEKFLHYTLALGLTERGFTRACRLLLAADAATLQSIGRDLARQRERLGLSQEALSERTGRLPLPLSEAYISHQEGGIISNSISVDLRYAEYLGADFNLIRELVTIRPLVPSVVKQAGAAETLHRIIDLSRRRDDRRAFGECVAWIQRTREGDPAIAKALLCSSIVMSNRGAMRAAAFLANEALRVNGCDDATKQKAIIQLAHVQSKNGLDGVVDRIFDRLPAPTRSDRTIRQLLTFYRGMALLRRNKPIEAAHWFEQTRALLGKDNEPAQWAATWVPLAEAYGLAGRRDEAVAALRRAQELLAEVDPPLRGHIQCNAGDAAVAAKLFDVAIEFFDGAYSTARQEQIPPLEFRAMLSRGEVALIRRDFTAARRELRDLKRRVQAVAHNPDLLCRFWKLVDALYGLTSG